MLCTSLAKYIPKYFIHFGAIVSEIVFLISLMYQNTIDFCKLILYPSNLLYLLKKINGLKFFIFFFLDLIFLEQFEVYRKF